MKEKEHLNKLKAIFLEDMGMGTSNDQGRQGPGSMQVLGRYLLIDELGSGASGRVFSAIHQDLKKKVALKIFTAPQKESKQVRTRFQREAITAAGLKHPNLVSVHDINIDGDFRYIAMDLVEGVTLDEWMKSDSITMNQRLEIMEKIARAVSYSHAKGVIHRDLKPSNIVINPSGEPIIVDFGLARSLFDDQVTHDGALIGTPRYMAPEQLRGDVSSLDKRTDLFALGVMFYEMVTNTAPFKGDSSEEIHESILNRKYPSPKELCSDLPGNMEALILKAMAPEPELRYQNGEDLADDLARLCSGRLASHVESKLHMRLKRLGVKLLRHPLITAASVLMLLILIWGGNSLYHQHQEQQRINHARSIESAYSRVSQQLESVIEKAEEQRYLSSVVEVEKKATLLKMEEILIRIKDNTGVGDGFRFFVHGMLNMPETMDFYVEACKNHPDNPIVYLLNARLFLRRLAESMPWPGDNGVNLYELETAYYAMTPENKQRLLKLIAATQRELKKARAICISTPLPAFHWITELNAAYSDLAGNRLEQAIGRLEQLQGIEDLCLEIYAPLTLACSMNKNFPNAIKAAQSLVKLRPNLIPARRTLASCYIQKGYSVVNKDPKEAVKCLLTAQKAIELIPDSYAAKKSMLGTLFLALGITTKGCEDDYEKHLIKAASLFTEAIKEGNATFQNFYNRSVAYAEQTDETSHAKCITDLVRAKAMNPQHPLVTLMLTQALNISLDTQSNKLSDLSKLLKSLSKTRNALSRHSNLDLKVSKEKVEPLYAKVKVILEQFITRAKEDQIALFQETIDDLTTIFENDKVDLNRFYESINKRIEPLCEQIKTHINLLFKQVEAELKELASKMPDSAELFYSQAQTEYIRARCIGVEQNSSIAAKDEYKNTLDLTIKSLDINPKLGHARRLKLTAWIINAQIEGISLEGLQCLFDEVRDLWENHRKFALKPQLIEERIKSIIKKPPHAMSLKSVSLLFEIFKWRLSAEELEGMERIKNNNVDVLEFLVRFSQHKEPEKALKLLEEIWSWAPAKTSKAQLERAFYRLELYCLIPGNQENGIQNTLGDIEKATTQIKDPTRLACAYELLGTYYKGEKAELSFNKALTLANEALKINPNRSEANLIKQAVLLSLKQENHGAPFTQINPRECAHGYYWCWFAVLENSPDPKTANRALRLAQALIDHNKSNDPYVSWLLGITLYRNGHLTEARDTLKNTIRLLRERGGQLFCLCLITLTLVEHHLGDKDQAHKFYSEVRPISQNYKKDYYIYALMKEAKEAIKINQ